MLFRAVPAIPEKQKCKISPWLRSTIEPDSDLKSCPWFKNQNCKMTTLSNTIEPNSNTKFCPMKNSNLCWPCEPLNPVLDVPNIEYKHCPQNNNFSRYCPENNNFVRYCPENNNFVRYCGETPSIRNLSKADQESPIACFQPDFSAKCCRPSICRSIANSGSETVAYCQPDNTQSMEDFDGVSVVKSLLNEKRRLIDEKSQLICKVKESKKIIENLQEKITETRKIKETDRIIENIEKKITEARKSEAHGSSFGSSILSTVASLAPYASTLLSLMTKPQENKEKSGSMDLIATLLPFITNLSNNQESNNNKESNNKESCESNNIDISGLIKTFMPMLSLASITDDNASVENTNVENTNDKNNNKTPYTTESLSKANQEVKNILTQTGN